MLQLGAKSLVIYLEPHTQVPRIAGLCLGRECTWAIRQSVCAFNSRFCANDAVMAVLIWLSSPARMARADSKLAALLASVIPPKPGAIWWGYRLGWIGAKPACANKGIRLPSRTVGQSQSHRERRSVHGAAGSTAVSRLNSQDKRG